jgi:5-methylcytosine-specific restriction endonuclease McrA
MTSLLDTEVLKVNKNWSPLATITVRQAFLDAFAGAVCFLRLEEGYPIVYSPEAWLKIPVLSGEDYVTHGRAEEKILVPRVAICTSYDKLRAKEVPCTSENLLRRYGNKDAVTGKRLSRAEMSREHVTPRSRGGENGWTNEVPMDKRLNSKRGNKPYGKVGLVAPAILPVPKPLLPISLIRNTHGYKEWGLFGIN